MKRAPILEINVHTGQERLDSATVERLTLALQACAEAILTLPAGPVPVLPNLDGVEINVVSDPVIQDVHERFLNDPSPTDVITFPYETGTGEIMVGYDTARRQAAEFGEPVLRELFRYMVHGLLHLHGYIDTEPHERERMFALQEPLVQQFAPQR